MVRRTIPTTISDVVWYLKFKHTCIIFVITLRSGQTKLSASLILSAAEPPTTDKWPGPLIHSFGGLVVYRNKHFNKHLSVQWKKDTLALIWRRPNADIIIGKRRLHSYIWLSLKTHWGRDKMAAISQTTFSNEFSWMKMYEFRLRFNWNLFLRFLSTIWHWFR